MKIEALTCPQCAAALNIAEDRDFYTCETCGAKLRVDRPATGPTRLTRFEVLLGRVVSQTRFLAASERLQILGGELTRANEALAQAAASIEVATTQRQTSKAKLRAAIKEKEGLVGLMVLLAIGTGFLTIQSLGSGSTLVWFLATVGLSAGAWYNYNQWKHLKQEMPGKSPSGRRTAQQRPGEPR
jgi:hypothetical protein